MFNQNVNQLPSEEGGGSMAQTEQSKQRKSKDKVVFIGERERERVVYMVFRGSMLCIYT